MFNLFDSNFPLFLFSFFFTVSVKPFHLSVEKFRSNFPSICITKKWDSHLIIFLNRKDETIRAATAIIFDISLLSEEILNMKLGYESVGLKKRYEKKGFEKVAQLLWAYSG